MESHSDTNGSESSKAFVDRTEDLDFQLEHADRLLAWECVHTAICAQRKLYPSRIADRIGVDTATVHDILNIAGHDTLMK